MKLRLETGNFNITGTVNNEKQDVEVATTLPKGLSYLDFIGCVVDFEHGAEVITAAFDDLNNANHVIIAFTTSASILDYNSVTGVLSSSSEPAGDSGNDSADPADPGDDSGDDGK